LVVDLQVSGANVDVSSSVEVVGEQQVIRSIAGSCVGALHGDEVRRQGLPHGCVGGVDDADEHSEQVVGNSHVARHFEPPVGSTPGSVVVASPSRSAGHPSHIVVSPTQSLLLSGVQVPMSDTPSGAQSHFRTCRSFMHSQRLCHSKLRICQCLGDCCLYR